MKGIIYPEEIFEISQHPTIEDGTYIRLKINLYFLKTLDQGYKSTSFFNQLLESHRMKCIVDRNWYIRRTNEKVGDWGKVKLDSDGLTEEIFMRVERL